MSSASGVPSIDCARSSRLCVRRSNTMSRAIMNNMIPPPIRNALKLIPSVRRRGSPRSAKKTRIDQAIATDRIAILRRCASLVPLVSERRSERSLAGR
jgi:hypothetical protein